MCGHLGIWVFGCECVGCGCLGIWVWVLGGEVPPVFACANLRIPFYVIHYSCLPNVLESSQVFISSDLGNLPKG